ncbi:bifunctional phosphopantothenoylcysteine decarboxylase/phosphopantothenate--cysteine ligase CoaBC [Schaalia sp. ZJ405]|uniref:bifunctional phosphopantothenoylcysteine decarboxylase/phosphopantothenate--cysteine ligase CoaBC n=1 Tax=Schaalia sp. ZJ405 TaxID=2709403 RepID=UPI0013ECF6FF|nr:bifunctional phosphopantothenoylcysteine decarboxylase/phosphopantothenate--cysteine ligase CoaBC [Schaalia sp. ZJ405]QPK82095.1 bifunctional phosphopantothenoylcysteine decarboxylase/phosphopantothenate--cysteine ligase CoaBC [Schaalia sp. ZJ405]
MARTVIVGIGAGIAAYKSALLVRSLQRSGLNVRVIPTPASLHFVGASTWEGLTDAPVRTDVFGAGGADHVELARIADLIVVAPATADLIARIRIGAADDLLTTTILAADCPVLLAPAMHTNMWESRATRDNIDVLRGRGLTILPPDSGALGSGDVGIGRMVDPEVIAEAVLVNLHHDDPNEEDRLPTADDAASLKGKRVAISAGGTREAIDPVRFIGNSSSGRQGIALAREAARRGADVDLVAANIDDGLLETLPDTVKVIRVTSSDELHKEMLALVRGGVDVVIMAAAVADFRPVTVATEKIKKNPANESAPTIILQRTTDILASLARIPERPQVLVGFAAETGTEDEVLSKGMEKARRKGADLLAINPVGQGRGFGDVPNSVTLVSGEGQVISTVSGTKSVVAECLMSAIAQRLGTISE